MATPKKNSHARKHNAAKRLVKEMTMAWSDKNPLSEESVIKAPVIGHRNMVLRINIAQLVAQFRKIIFEQMTMRWLVKMDLVFKYPNKDQYIEEIEFEADCVLHSLNDHCLEHHVIAMRKHNAEAYQVTNFFIECIDFNLTEARENDSAIA